MKDWMENLDPIIKNVPLVHIAIPGSHDSMTYTIRGSSPKSPDNNPVVNFMLTLLGRIGRKYMFKWCVTQDRNVWEQLKLGIRYLDFRVATKKSDSKIYFCHGLYGDEVSTYLTVINDFLETFKGEILIMDFQHFYDFKEEDHFTLIDLIKKSFGNEKLCPHGYYFIEEITINWMLKNGYRVIVIYRDIQIESMSIAGLWPGDKWVSPWPNTSSVDTLQEFVQESLHSERDFFRGFITQCVLTPDTKMLTLNPIASLKNKCARPVMKKLGPWLKEQLPGPYGVNIVIADFVDTGAFYSLIIGLNDYFVNK